MVGMFPKSVPFWFVQEYDIVGISPSISVNDASQVTSVSALTPVLGVIPTESREAGVSITVVSVSMVFPLAIPSFGVVSHFMTFPTEKGAEKSIGCL